MKSNIEQKKREMKEKFNKNVDDFFTQYNELIDNDTMTINEIERIWGDGLKMSREIYADTLKELSEDKSSQEEEKKSNVPVVEET